ncbi:MAG: hypothetical protein HOD92_09525 [Deltaproteobacteria bacterium]|jgi:hypothetical protein|nr:hypothetical protein [Deltaproteobacteria bacterium]MBT4525598.1 hypothetical protein [Deltaproteobacteria bacterium]
MKQYSWKRNKKGEIIFDYTDAELSKRKNYLKQVVDANSKANWRDIQDIIIYQSNPGKKVVCWGAGSGKTTAIRQYITKNYKQGFVYAARTIDECNLFYYDLIAFIGESRVVKWHSQIDKSTRESIDRNPSYLMSRYVLVMTHEKLIQESPYVYSTLSISDSVQREYIFVDEKPSFYKSHEFDETSVATIMNCVSEIKPDKLSGYKKIPAENQQKAVKILEGKLVLKEACVERNEAETAVKILSGSSEFSEINRYRAYANLKIFYDYVLNFRDTSEREHSAQSTLSNLKFSEIAELKFFHSLSTLDVPNILIFDGTGDLILRNSRVWQIIKPDKYSYNFKGTVGILNQWSVERTRTKDNVSEEEINTAVIEIIDRIIELKKKSDNLLVVIWKSFKPAEGEFIEEDISNQYTKELSLKENLIETLKKRISKDLTGDEIVDDEILKNDHGIMFTSYQSGKTRGTSEFSSADSIVFFGKYFIPNSAIQLYNKVNFSEMTTFDNTIAELTQTTYRTRIRSDDPKPVNIYFTDDWDLAVIDQFLKYINAKTVDGDPLEIYDYTTNVERKIGAKYPKFIDLRSNLRADIISLAQEYPSLATTSKLKIPLDKISTIIPRSKRKRDRYQTLINRAKECGLDIEII